MNIMPSYFSHGRSPETNADTSLGSSNTTNTTNHIDSRSERPGHFPDIGKFLIINPQDQNAFSSDSLNWQLGHEANLHPRAVIYIQDKSVNTRINDRVMLVLRKNKGGPSFTCLSFCWHNDLDFDEPSQTMTHRQAVSGGSRSRQLPPPQSQGRSPHSHALDSDASIEPRLPSVEVELRVHGVSGLQPHIYLNCEALWNVEREVNVAVLGKVSVSSFKAVVEHVKRLFCESLDKAVHKAEHAAPKAEYSAHVPPVEPSRSTTAPLNIPQHPRHGHGHRHEHGHSRRVHERPRRGFFL
ncbi:uncharacterized protein Z518_10660 [Rhinocladiella mackenziei CBS 650.93]|uniref:Rhinocladiella mackenziei CBS 650.93 unplaced genomic scaffold supercont1.9, whole genome shotgun sequence n=1 Tax=Rhinocladiella mackenziei CBS 650.93 TaxID=1442369 RepID=A0A0D2IV11_9EURO|nr:uncharacterized protein Z518_10660 [Rhinocladiella mackenziei CBS 650.93]KIX00520.1 hypothetical protein Z518_10660 [Rhinocladiella mackenziei CBS 650.93]